MDIETLLEQSSLFQWISAESRKAVASICIPKAYGKRETIFMEGQKGHSMYLLAQGAVQLSKTSQDGKEAVIKLIQPGEMFAEAILFEKDEYPVSAVALTAVEAFLIPRRQFLCLLEGEGFRNDFIAMLLAKQRYLADRVFQVTALDVERRFYNFLRDHFGEHEEYRIELSKRDIALAIDALPETLSRLLLKLKEEGALEWDGDVLKLKKGFWANKEM
jgi:CRP-like cAMP-binding protein